MAAVVTATAGEVFHKRSAAAVRSECTITSYLNRAIRAYLRK